MLVMLVRHGETQWNEERRLQGQQDIGLSEVGRAQVASLRGAVHRLHPDRVIASGLSRTQQTAEVLEVPIHAVDPGLNEAHLGAWEAQYSRQIRTEHPECYVQWRGGRYQPPGAESFTEMTARVTQSVHQAVSAADQDGVETLMLVTHGGPVRAYLSTAVGLDPHQAVPSHPASLSLVDVDPSDFSAKLRLYNYSPSFTPLDPPD